MSIRTILSTVGKALVVAGGIVLLFVAYELWGTGLTTASHQRALRQQFNEDLRSHHFGPSKPTIFTTGPDTTPVTTSHVGSVQSPLAPPAEGQPVGIIDIPKIGVNFVIVQGTSTADLERGPGHYIGTSLPGNPGNAAIAGHRTTYLRPFYNLNQLVPGDPIYVTTAQGRFRYDVTNTLVVSPNDVGVLKPAASPTLTLTTCNPRYSASTRMVVQAALVTTVVAAVPRTTPFHVSTAMDRNLAASQGGWWIAMCWGLACVIYVTVNWFIWRHMHHWWMPSVGLVGILALLFFLFGAVSPLLPAGY